MARFANFESTLGSQSVAVNPDRVTFVADGGKTNNRPFTRIYFGDEHGIDVYGSMQEVLHALKTV